MSMSVVAEEPERQSGQEKDSFSEISVTKTHVFLH